MLSADLHFGLESTSHFWHAFLRPLPHARLGGGESPTGFNVVSPGRIGLPTTCQGWHLFCNLSLGPAMLQSTHASEAVRKGLSSIPKKRCRVVPKMTPKSPAITICTLSTPKPKSRPNSIPQIIQKRRSSLLAPPSHGFGGACAGAALCRSALPTSHPKPWRMNEGRKSGNARKTVRRRRGNSVENFQRA